MKLRIALAQTCPLSAPPGVYSPTQDEKGDPLEVLRANLADAEEKIRQAKEGGAEVVCFAEYFLQGILNEGRQYLSLLSRQLEARLSTLAQTHDVAITGTIVHGSSDLLPPCPRTEPFSSVSLPEQDDQDRQQWTAYFLHNREALSEPSHFTLLNEAFFIDRHGKKLGSYTKKNLWHPEREYLKPGVVDEPLFDTPWGKAGFLICWDLSHPAAATRLAEQGADLIFAPAYWLGVDSEPMLSRYNPDPDYEFHVVQSLCYARAFETETVLIHTNPGGDRPKDGFMGGSGVWAPLLGRIGGCDKEKIGVKVIEVDLAVLTDARDTYKIREDAAVRNGT